MQMVFLGYGNRKQAGPQAANDDKFSYSYYGGSSFCCCLEKGLSAGRVVAER